MYQQQNPYEIPPPTHISPGKQYYLPDSAMRNRKHKQFLTEMPQGQKYFSSCQKKQYSLLHNRSEIKDSSLFDEGQKIPVTHNNLCIEDIEGATTNTLVSQAIKNLNRNSGKGYRLRKFQSEKNVKSQVQEPEEEELIPHQNYNSEAEPPQYMKVQEKLSNARPMNYHISQKNRLHSEGNQQCKRKKLSFSRDIVHEKLDFKVLKKVENPPRQLQTIDVIQSEFDSNKASPKVLMSSQREEQSRGKEPLIYQLGNYRSPNNSYHKKQMHKRLWQPSFVPQSQIRKLNPTFLPENLHLYRHGHEFNRKAIIANPF